jgi:hypothetical protein
MKNVQIICGLDKVTTDRNIEFDRSMVVDRRNYRYKSLSPGETVTVPCPLRTAIRLPGSVRSAEVILWVEYRWLFWPKKLATGQMFVGERDAKGSLQWSARPLSGKLVSTGRSLGISLARFVQLGEQLAEIQAAG